MNIFININGNPLCGHILTSVRYNEKESILNRKKSVAYRHSGLRPGIQYMQPNCWRKCFSWIPGPGPEWRYATDFLRFRAVPFAFRMITFFLYRTHVFLLCPHVLKERFLPWLSAYYAPSWRAVTTIELSDACKNNSHTEQTYYHSHAHGLHPIHCRHHTWFRAQRQKVTFRAVKGYLSYAKRPPFTSQKVTFWKTGKAWIVKSEERRVENGISEEWKVKSEESITLKHLDSSLFTFNSSLILLPLRTA